MNKLFLIILITLGITALTGCNTVDGMGKDVEAAGESMQDASN